MMEDAAVDTACGGAAGGASAKKLGEYVKY